MDGIRAYEGMRCWGNSTLLGTSKQTEHLVLYFFGRSFIRLL